MRRYSLPPGRGFSRGGKRRQVRQSPQSLYVAAAEMAGEQRNDKLLLLVAGILFRFGSNLLLLGNNFLPSNNLLLLGSRRLSVGCKHLRLDKRRFLPSNNLLLFGKRRLLLSSGRLSVGSKRLLFSRRRLLPSCNLLLPVSRAASRSASRLPPLVRAIMAGYSGRQVLADSACKSLAQMVMNYAPALVSS